MGSETESRDRNRQAIKKMLREAERRELVARPRSRLLAMFAGGLGVAVLLAFAYTIYFGAPPWQRQPAPLPKIIGANPNAISPSEITVVDGDTIKARGRTIHLVGFDATETDLNARCARERQLGERATAQLRSLVAGGSLELRMVPCACPPGTEGMRECNYGRACGYPTRTATETPSVDQHTAVRPQRSA